MVMFLSSSFLNLTVWTPEMALTTVDFPWATWPMVPGKKRRENESTVFVHPSGGGQDANSDGSELHTDVDCSLSADDLLREWG